MLQQFRDELALQGCIRISFRVQPNAPSTRVVGVMVDGTVKIAIAAPPERGKANAELVRFLAVELEVPMENVEIVSGKKARLKAVKICR